MFSIYIFDGDTFDDAEKNTRLFWLCDLLI